MVIELEMLDSNDIYLEEAVSFPDTYFSNDVKEINNILVKGVISKDDYGKIHIKLNVTGKMLIEDSISLKDVYYPFDCEIDEILEQTDKKDNKTIDITDILWQNIILEVPLRYTEISDFSEFQGDGWKLVGEEEINNSNNPFKSLIDNKEEE